MPEEPCTWCGKPVEADDGFRAYEPAGSRRAVFCRLEHVVPWEMQGPHWEADQTESLAAGQAGPAGKAEEPAHNVCSHCDAELTDSHVLLVRHRGEHRITDAFCSSGHLGKWAKAGGRYSA